MNINSSNKSNNYLQSNLIATKNSCDNLDSIYLIWSNILYRYRKRSIKIYSK